MSQDYLYFGSGQAFPEHCLSNFFQTFVGLHECSVTEGMETVSPHLKEWIRTNTRGVALFPSSEHLWQSFKATNVKTWKRFTVYGDLASLVGDSARALFTGMTPKGMHGTPMGVQKVKTKIQHWAKKNNIGILAKMAADRKYAKVLQFEDGDLDYDREHLTLAVQDEIWARILELKFEQNSTLKAQIIATGKSILIEIDRNAARRRDKCYWGGLVGEDGKIVGKNTMGRYLMATRERMLQAQ